MVLDRSTLVTAAVGLTILSGTSAHAQVCEGRKLVQAHVVAIDMPMVFNRLGAQNVNWQMFALAHDLVRRKPNQGPAPLDASDWATPSSLVGNVTLRPDLRPRPLALRVAAGDCLQVRFTNLLTKVSNPFQTQNRPLLPAAHPMDQASSAPSMNIDDQVASRGAGFHPNGLELVKSIASDASHVGRNPSSLAQPGQTRTYVFFAPAEGAFLVSNPGAVFGGEGTAGSSGTGLFGAVAVQPARARVYRGQVTEEELRLATRKVGDASLVAGSFVPCAHDAALACTPGGQPVIDYDARYPSISPWKDEGKAGLPILAMHRQDASGAWHVVHGDINAIVIGPQKDGSFPPSTYPIEKLGADADKVLRNPTLPNRLEAFREFISVYHDENAAAQAFPGLFDDPVLGRTLHGVRDAFMINYGSGGVGAEVIANRLGVGPMHDCVDCAFEEFFLSSFAVGDPALLVDKPANAGLENVKPATNLPAPDLVGVTAAQLQALRAQDAAQPDLNKKLLGPKAKRVFYPHDPANVHHSYLNDFVKFRNVHTGKEQHIFHLHNHQWLFNPNDDNSNYIDAQALGPGAGYTYEIAFGGSGNRNKSAGDAVFHCHFYPHFAQGMWYLWRIHDTFEAGTSLAVSKSAGGFHSEPFALADGTPAKGSRALPDGELVAGTPIPALVPLPGKALPPLPGQVEVVAHPRQLPDGRPIGSLAKVIDRKNNPGYPFWIAGIEHTVGARPTTPPLDMTAAVGGADGGVPRHAVEGLSAGSEAESTFTRLDAAKHEVKIKPLYFPEQGTDLEKIAMHFHAQPQHASFSLAPGGGVAPSPFITNGAKPTPGAPFFDPCVDDARQRLDAGVQGRFFGSDGQLSLPGASPFNADTPRIYKGANVQLNVTLNKIGDHYPQQRILTLWEDVDATLLTSYKPSGPAGVKPRAPEPLVLRMNTFDCARYLHTNLVPKEFEMDDYQVRTPTDVIGQHIHLPKWDLPSADGSANGWNYEDGTFSPGMVRSRIHAINEWNAAPPAGQSAVPNPYSPGQPAHDPAKPPVAANAELAPRAHYFFGLVGPFQSGECEALWKDKGYKSFHNGPGGLAVPGQCDWLGARTTMQRWFSDPVINKEHAHRGLGITFTHDHLGPSTHQQVGLYATMLTEPPASTWVHNESGELLYDRDAAACNDLDPTTWATRRCDGGPTSWQAVIDTGEKSPHESHREFFLQFGDFQHAYRKGHYLGLDEQGVRKDFRDPAHFSAYQQGFRQALTPGDRKPANPNLPEIVALHAKCSDELGNGSVPRPCPEIISADDVGTMVVNYRQEPLSWRVFDAANKRQSFGSAGDMALAFQTRTDRAQGEFNTTTGATPYAPLTHDVRPGDPFTPIIRAYSGDLVRVRIQAGSHEHEHNGAANGLKWLQAGSGFGRAPHSGWRGAQNIGLSEQFTLSMRITDYWEDQHTNATDRLLAIDSGQDGLWNGAWGFVRTLARRDPGPDTRPAFRDDQDRLVLVPGHPQPTLLGPLDPAMKGNECPKDAAVRAYTLVAGLAKHLLPPTPLAGGANGTLVYNPRATTVTLNIFDESTGALVGTQQHGVGPLHDPTAIIIVRKSDIDPATRRLRSAAPLEPVVLRAAAGECVQVVLESWLPRWWELPSMPDLAGFTTLSMQTPLDIGAGASEFTSFNNNRIRPSRRMGLHPQMVQYDVQSFDGMQVGVNNPSWVAPGGSMLYKWYAGSIEYGSAAQCKVIDERAQSYALVNRLRAQLRETPDGPRRLRAPNDLFTPESLLTRLEALVKGLPQDQPTVAPLRGEAEPLPPRLPLRLDTATQARLRALYPGFEPQLLVATGAPPPQVNAAAYVDALSRTVSALLVNDAVAACIETVVPPLVQALQTAPPPAELLRALTVPGAAAAAAPDGVPLYPPQAAFSRIEALDRREACSKQLAAPMAAAVRAGFANIPRINERTTQIAGKLALGVAYQLPELDHDAFGSREFAAAFQWYRPGTPDQGLLSPQTTRLVTLRNGIGDELCRYAPIEFGGSNLTPPDRIKQGQKAAVGALIVEPQRSAWIETGDDFALDRQNPPAPPAAPTLRRTRSTAHVFYPADAGAAVPSDWHYMRDLVAVHQKGLNLRYRKAPLTTAVRSLAAEREGAGTPTDRTAPEDAHDAGQMAVNYGTEPLWYRFGIEPAAPFGHGPKLSDPLSRGEGFGGLRFTHQVFANTCCSTNPNDTSHSAPQPHGEPYVPIFSVRPQAETRLRVLLPTGSGRASVMALHGHGWARDPYLAERTQPLTPFGAIHLPAGDTPQYGIASQCEGANALGMHFGANDSVTPMQHFDFLLPRAGGTDGVSGDYLLRDIGGFGVTSGLWSLIRVEGARLPAFMVKGPRTRCR